ncbi:hypothetical protein BDR26DRAFT_851147 [Obelidium mucronatum]|nr:hypothetical protein BDR26DRAFT_851147 [Obelidium mucronatum]
MLLTVNGTTLFARESRFGPSLAAVGPVTGVLVRPDDDTGCQALPRAAVRALVPPAQPWVAVVRSGNCSFAAKVRAMQSSGAAAVVVGAPGVDGRFLVAMTAGADEDVSAIAIPSVYVGNQYSVLVSTNNDLINATLAPASYGATSYSSLGIILFILSPLIIPFIFLLLERLGIYIIVDRHPKRVATLATKTWSETDSIELKDHSQCSICLDEYALGERIRILPCGHWFHGPCIDRWLSKQTPSCPLCKGSIFSENQSLSFQHKIAHDEIETVGFSDSEEEWIDSDSDGIVPIFY